MIYLSWSVFYKLLARIVLYFGLEKRLRRIGLVKKFFSAVRHVFACVIFPMLRFI